jgi:hypothetical protein
MWTYISNEGENAKYEKCVVLFHSIRNLDVKLQLGHPLPLKTLVKVHQYQICISFPRWTMYTTEWKPAKYWKLIYWINDMFRQWKELALWPHSDLVSFCPSDCNIIFTNPTATKYHSKNQSIRLHNDLLILHMKQKHSKRIVLMFNWWTCVISVYCIWRIRCHNYRSNIFKEKK